MSVFRDNILGLKKVSLILGFFDGIHAGHVNVIKSGVDFAKKNGEKSVLLTFFNSPSEYFGKKFDYIYPRKISYELISELGVDYIIEKDFSSLANINASDYLESLIKDFEPISISTGFNHTFGQNKKGNPLLLEEYSAKYGYKYFCVSSCLVDSEVASSTRIKELLLKGEIERANKILLKPFKLESEVIHGAKLGRQIGFPTANMKYPEKVVKIPYGVYLVKVDGKTAILNWGKKPSVGDFQEVLEVHIPNFNQDLYGQILRIELIKKIRDELKFSSIEELKNQIAKDVEECLKL